jgi:hypothetical protein
LFSALRRAIHSARGLGTELPLLPFAPVPVLCVVSLEDMRRRASLGVS